MPVRSGKEACANRATIDLLVARSTTRPGSARPGPIERRRLSCLPRFPGLRADSARIPSRGESRGFAWCPRTLALLRRGNGSAVDADTPAIADEAVASGGPWALLQLVHSERERGLGETLAFARKHSCWVF